MPSHVQKMPQARADLVEIADFIAQDNPDAAARFVPALEATYDKLVALPGMGSVRQWRARHGC
jgi:plasmid stabilization system protein ParE